MADTKTTALTEITAPVSTDLVYVVGDPGTTPVSRKATLATIRKTIMVDGWIEAGSTWTYASADAPTFTFTITGDLTGKYSPGMRIKLTQTTVKYFIITAVSYGAPNTTVTIYGGTDYTLANAAITLPYYSAAKAPFGFPVDPAKWTVLVTDANLCDQASPSASTWYNAGTVSISVPIGAWRIRYDCFLHVTKGSAATLDEYVTLSTANNTQSDATMTAYIYMLGATGVLGMVGREKLVTVAAKTAHYLNISTASASLTHIYIRGDLVTTTIRAICAYL